MPRPPITSADPRSTSAWSSRSAGNPPTPPLVVDGPLAEEWIGVAQAFAGPPGAGRPARREA